MGTFRAHSNPSMLEDVEMDPVSFVWEALALRLQYGPRQARADPEEVMRGRCAFVSGLQGHALAEVDPAQQTGAKAKLKKA